MGGGGGGATFVPILGSGGLPARSSNVKKLGAEEAANNRAGSKRAASSG